jgi:N,N'-diacetyllegionaminate synthase
MKPTMTPTNKVIIIAEAGVNHNGDLRLAKKLIEAAADAGADYVKFQTFQADKVVTKTAMKAEYQVQNTGNNESQLDMIRKLQLSVDDHLELVKYCREKNISFLSTPFDLDSIDLLVELGVTIGKVPSGEITNLPYLRKMARSFRQIIISTGMSTMEEVRFALSVFLDNGTDKNNITILHCNTEYPTPFGDVNLRAMVAMSHDLQVPTGYSDHTVGIEVPIAAVAMGAVLIEKHFTLDKEADGPDHKASLDPAELKQMVLSIRNIEKALGSADKKPTPSEIKNMNIARRSIVAACFIAKGDVFTEDKLTVKRPGNGISPIRWDEVIGKKAVRDFDTDELITI